MIKKKDWTYEELQVLARKAGTRNNLQKLKKTAYTAARLNGWLDSLFGSGRCDDCGKNMVSTIVTTPRPKFNSFEEKQEWQRKTSMRIQKSVYGVYRSPRQSIIIAEPMRTTEKGKQRFTVDLNMLKITNFEREEFKKAVEGIDLESILK